MAYKVINKTRVIQTVGTYIFPLGESYGEKLSDTEKSLIDRIPNLSYVQIDKVPEQYQKAKVVNPALRHAEDEEEKREASTQQLLESDSPLMERFDEINEMDAKSGVSAVEEVTDPELLKLLEENAQFKTVRDAASKTLQAIGA